MELRDGGLGDLFAAKGAGAGQWPAELVVQMASGRQGLALLCRLAAAELAAILGLQGGADLSVAARILQLSASPVPGGGIEIALTGNRPKVGVPLARPVSADSGDWLVGPVALPVAPPERAGLLADYTRQGLMPLTWKSVAGWASRSRIVMPDLLALRAEVGDGNAILLPGAMAARRRAIRPEPPRAACEPAVAMLPFGPPGHPPAPASQPAAATRMEDGEVTGAGGGTVPARAAVPRHGRLRVTLGATGRLGVTLTRAAMDALWAGRADDAERPCAVVCSGADLLILPGGDPLSRHLAGLPVRMRRTEAAWYGRAPVGGRAGSTPLASLGAAALREGNDFTADLQPGRLVLRGALRRSVPAPRPSADMGQLGEARRMMSEALALVRAARQAGGMGTPEIEFLDDEGRPLLSVPPDAAAARIRVEVA